MASSLVPGCHVMSDLLTIRERGILFTLLEPQCKLLKTTVAQVLEAKDTQGESPGWGYLGCGVVCLIEDESVHSYFLRLYCVKRAKLLWEQEVYIPFKYTATRMFFHTFPADSHQIGFNFANQTEAEEFYLTVKAVQRKQENMTDMIKMTDTAADTSTSDPPDSGMKPVEHLDMDEQFPLDAPSSTVTPATSSFQDLDPAMRRLLMQAKLPVEDLKDKDIAEAVDCIINKFGGIKAVQRELRNKDIAKSCRGIHLHSSKEKAFATGPSYQRQHHLPTDTTALRWSKPVSDSSSSAYTSSS
ncbi:actin nucleation-promoting factor WASL-like isoform X2 [Lates calcarifer]|uniref:Actin nucleation-promoting factor WASL isoform X2 n=1 Tax=Lates calcarifer TaxID=8187 RepID=A0AAJ7LPU8_LATCA|nr:actin nucleation-promoting factor WASL isoform X2 [Lates calcarifer]XP_018542028.1 actin nucleation-promoting factor WASL-like isoform X2 [Lates calcarifer]